MVECWNDGFEDRKNGIVEEWNVGMVEYWKNGGEGKSGGVEEWNVGMVNLLKNVGNCEIRSAWIERMSTEGSSSSGFGRMRSLCHLNISLGSCGEFHSCYESFKQADQIDAVEFEQLDALHYRVENQLLKLIESLQKKQKNNEDWDDTFYSE